MRHPRSTSNEATEFARQLRRDMTPSERRLWKVLRDRNHGFKFRRQYPIAGYTLDFFCPEASVCVEIDGETHVGREHRDVRRDEVLAELGIVTLRFVSDAISQDLGYVLWRICETCRCRVPKSTAGENPSPQPSPFEGEGEGAKRP